MEFVGSTENQGGNAVNPVYSSQVWSLSNQKTGCVCRNQPGGTKSTQPPNACRQSMFRSPSYLSSSYLTWSPSAAVPIEFVVAAAGRSTTPPSPCRGLFYTPSHAPGDLYSDPFSPMSPRRHPGTCDQRRSSRPGETHAIWDAPSSRSLYTSMTRRRRHSLRQCDGSDGTTAPLFFDDRRRSMFF